MDVRYRLILKQLALILVFISVLFGATNTNLTGSVVSASQSADPATPSYSCFNCFALAYWQGAPLDGMSSDIQIRPLDHCCVPDYFISNKMYLTSYLSNHWMEVGYRTRMVGYLTTNTYFWADKRPIDNTYHLWYLGDAGVDWYQTTNFYVERVGTDSFDAVIDTPGHNYVGHSVDNTIAPGWIDIGTELRGTSGSTMSGSAHWTNNMWKAPPGFNCGPRTPWCFQTANGGQAVTNAGTLLGGWVKTPSGSETGGDWFTSCCNAMETAP